MFKHRCVTILILPCTASCLITDWSALVHNLGTRTWWINWDRPWVSYDISSSLKVLLLRHHLTSLGFRQWSRYLTRPGPESTTMNVWRGQVHRPVIVQIDEFDSILHDIHHPDKFNWPVQLVWNCKVKVFAQVHAKWYFSTHTSIGPMLPRSPQQEDVQQVHGQTMWIFVLSILTRITCQVYNRADHDEHGFRARRADGSKLHESIKGTDEWKSVIDAPGSDQHCWTDYLCLFTMVETSDEAR